MEHLVALVFAVFFLWTTLLHWTPRQPPSWTRPLIALALSLAVETIPPRPLDILAATGAMGFICYVWNVS